MTIVLNGDTGITTPTYGGNVTSEYLVPVTSMKNRIINGAMVIDQRNAGASVTIPVTTTTYTLDRWVAFATGASKYSIQQNAGSVTPPAGFTKYLGVTSLAATSLAAGDYYFICQKIEGYNCADLGFGAAGASTVTFSFWVRSSLTGTFGGALNNGDSTRAYPFTYTISAANTWEQKTVTVAGDTSGTWDTTNGKSIIVIFGLGVGSTYSGTAGSWSGNGYFSATGATSVVGTNGATFYITGVQLEKGSTATSFDYRPYGTELALCQRYFLKTFDQSVAPAQNAGRNGSLRAYAWTTSANTVPIGITWQYPVEMRSAPTLTTYNPNAANSSWRNNGNSGDAAAATAEIGTRNALIYINASLGATDSFVIHAAGTAEL